MNGRDSTQSLLVLRKLTRAITEAVRQQVTEHLATFTPLLRPTTVLAEYVQGGQKESSRKAEKAFHELETLYQTVATAQPFNLPRELSTPLSFQGGSLEITPHDYAHLASAGGDARTINVRSPLTWTLTYSGFAPSRLTELLSAKLRSNDELQRVVLSYLLMNVVTTNQPGVLKILEALHLPITTVKLSEFGGLPITRIGASIPTSRPSDAVIIESAQLTGMDAFEELVDLDEISRMRDPLRERLLDIAHQHAPELMAR